MENGREVRVAGQARRQDRLMLACAVVLTVVMFGWQGYHLYSANEAASHEQTATLVEAVHSAGERQIRLVDDLEHEVLVMGRTVAAPPVDEWPDRYAAASGETRAATASASAGIGERLARPIGMVESARVELDRQVVDVLQRLAQNADDASAALLDPQYLAAQEEFARAVDGQIADLAGDLEAKTAAERLTELHSVAVALVLFTAAIGAWAVFGRNLRRSRARLATEQERRLAAEAEASQMQKMEALGMMADGIAHDVKNLTVVILGSADEVRRGLPEGHRVVPAVTRIEEATRQADDMAAALLAFSRKAESPKGAVNLASLATSMTQLLKYMVPPPIELTVEAPTAAWVRGDPVQLQQVIFNLVANAREAMPHGGRLSITVRAASYGDEVDGPVWLLVVEDTGEGMSDDVVEHLFEPFFTTRPSGRGCGLGLAIVRRTVSDHGGWIRVSSSPGEGSTFTIGLPARPAPRRAVDGPDRDEARVLVANPTAIVRDLISGALAAEGYRTLAASTVDEISDCFAPDRPAVDLAVIDAALLVRTDLPLPPGVPVILTGAGADAVDLARRGGVRVVGEPLSLAVLTRSVTELLQPADAPDALVAR